MSFNLRRHIPTPAWLVLALASVTGLSWMLSAHLVGRLAEKPGMLSGIASPILLELGKAMFIGTSVGLFLNYYLKRITEPGPGETLEIFGIRSIHQRLEAINEFLAAVRDVRTKKVWLMGISLRDFLMGGGALRNVWEEIYRRLEDEQQRNVSERDRLHVRLLFLDPRSGAGLIRQKIEEKTIGAGGLHSDVPIALGQVRAALASLYSGAESPFLDARLYEHCPFAFCFLTDHALFLEQYLYRDHTQRAALPLLKVGGNTPAYGQFLWSYDAIWSHARPAILPAVLAEHHTGVADGIANAGIQNIYRHNQRHQLGSRQMECMRTTPPGNVISIQAITGKFYMQNALGVISEKSSGENPVRVRFLIINPVSQQAILRAVADSCKQDDMGEALSAWDWERHRRSKLYIDAWQSIWQYRRLREVECLIEMHLTPAPLTSALLMTPQSAFVEQYVYGRSQQQRKGIVLGAMYPVFEFQMQSGVEQEILQSAFEVMWDWFSIPVDAYDKDGEEGSFHRNLELVRGYSRSDAAGETFEAATPLDGAVAAGLHSLLSTEEERRV